MLKWIFQSQDLNEMETISIQSKWVFLFCKDQQSEPLYLDMQRC